MIQMEKEKIKCPQCGSRDLTKVQVSSSQVTPTDSAQYKCIICGKHFSYTATKEA